MIRYLLHVSYIGTAFRGVTHIDKFYKYRDLRTVQGTLECVIKHVFKRRCDVCCSSRTDARVHALQSTFHVDIPDVDENTVLHDDKKFEMIADLNENLKVLRAAIRIGDIEIVNRTNFEAYRNVDKRSYMYRIGIKPTGKNGEFNVPIEEIDRCFFIESNTFDVDKFKRAAQMFIGKHDFRSFMRWSSEEKTQTTNYTQRKMFSVEVKESKPCVISSHLDVCQNSYKFYDIKFTANSYVYRQIRRIIGALCAVAEGKIDERDIYELLTIPSHQMWSDLVERNLVKTAPPCGLYFIGLNYRNEENRYLGPVRLTPRGIRIRSFVDDSIQIEKNLKKLQKIYEKNKFTRKCN